jgi:hypothetical protein
MRLPATILTSALSFLGLALPGGRAVAEDFAVQVVIDGVVALAPFDNGSQADFFAEMDIGGVGYRSDIVLDRDRFVPGWSHYAVFSRDDLLANGLVDISVGLRETDDRFGESSRDVAISPYGGVFDLFYTLRVDPRGGAILLFDRVTGRPVRQLQPMPGGNTWTTGRMFSAGRYGNNARIGFVVNVVRLPRYRF